MKMLKYLIPVMLFGLLACNGRSEEKDHNDHDNSEVNNEQTETQHHHDEGQAAVQLDNGKKWKADAETISGINNMAALVQDGIAGKIEGQKLNDTLQVAFKTIFDKCTMTGEAHNQLHNFLLPRKGQLDKLKTGSSPKETLEEMEEHLTTFKNYFE